MAALGCWAALAGSLTSGLAGAGELQWRSAKVASTPVAPVASPLLSQTAVAAAWDEAEQVPPAAAASPVTPEGPRSVVVRRDGDRLAQAADPFDPFDAEMPSTEPVSAPAGQPQYDPFDDPTTEDAKPQVEPNSFPAPSLEEAFEEPAVDQPPAEEPADDEETETAEQLEQARQAIDREMMRRESQRKRDAELASPDADVESAQPELEAEPGMTDEADEIDAPPAPEFNDAEPIVEEVEEFQLPENDDSGLQYGGEVEPLPPPTPEQLEIRRQQIEKERLQALAECNKLYDEVRADNIKDISLDIRQQGRAGEDFPFECEGRRPPFQPRNWAPVTYMWKASGLCHKPLYFEQVQLERYGHDWGPVLQPIMSGAHFFGTIPILPYKMGLQTPNECDYALGYYRPGSCAPYMIEPLGFTWRAAAFQAGAVTGAAFAIP